MTLNQETYGSPDSQQGGADRPVTPSPRPEKSTFEGSDTEKAAPLGGRGLGKSAPVGGLYLFIAFLLILYHYFAQSLSMVALVLYQKGSEGLRSLSTEMTQILSNDPNLMAKVLIGNAILAIPVYLLYLRIRKKQGVALAQMKGIRGQDYLFYICQGMAFQGGLGLLLNGIYQLGKNLPWLADLVETYNEGIQSSLFPEGVVPWLTLVGGGILIPLAEELLFRGIVMGELEKVWPGKPTLLLQALLFAAFHLNFVQGFYVFFIALLLGLVYQQSKSLIAPILIHMVINSYSIILGTVAQQSQKTLVAFGLVSFTMMIIGAVWGILRWRARKKLGNI